MNTVGLIESTSVLSYPSDAFMNDEFKYATRRWHIYNIYDLDGISGCFVWHQHLHCSFKAGYRLSNVRCKCQREQEISVVTPAQTHADDLTFTLVRMYRLYVLSVFCKQTHFNAWAIVCLIPGCVSTKVKLSCTDWDITHTHTQTHIAKLSVCSGAEWSSWSSDVSHHHPDERRPGKV